jgi:hypothetical protein
LTLNQGADDEQTEQSDAEGEDEERDEERRSNAQTVHQGHGSVPFFGH